MSAREETLTRIAADLAQLLGIPELRFDDDDCICLEFDDLACTLLAAEDRLILHAELARLSAISDCAGVYRTLMSWNAELAVADGAVALATDSGADSVALSCTITPLYAPGADLLETLMSRFLELVQDVQLRLGQFSVTEQAQQDFSGAVLRV